MLTRLQFSLKLLILVLPMVALFCISLLLLILLLKTKSFSWNIRIILISTTISSQIYSTLMVIYVIFGIIIRNPDISSWIMLIIELFMYSVFWHTLPISLERALLVCNSYNNTRRPAFISLILIITVGI